MQLCKAATFLASATFLFTSRVDSVGASTLLRGGGDAEVQHQHVKDAHYGRILEEETPAVFLVAVVDDFNNGSKETFNLMLADNTIYEMEDLDEDWKKNEGKSWRSGSRVNVPLGVEFLKNGKAKMNGKKPKINNGEANNGNNGQGNKKDKKALFGTHLKARTEEQQRNVDLIHHLSTTQGDKKVVAETAINNQHHHNHHRVLQEKEEFTFLIVDIQYEDGVTAASRRLQGNSQGKGRGNNNPNMPERTINIEDAGGMIYEIEEGSGSVEGIPSGAKVTLPDSASMNAQGKVTLNGGALKRKSPRRRSLTTTTTTSVTSSKKKTHVIWPPPELELSLPSGSLLLVMLHTAFPKLR